MESIQATQEDNGIRMMVEIYMFIYAHKVREAVEDLNCVPISNVQFQYDDDHLHPIILMLRHSNNMSLCHQVRYRRFRSETDP
jgi:hypothetical protein